jgi:stage III sporulation protein AE
MSLSTLFITALLLDFSPQEALKRIINYFLREVMVNLSLLGKLLIIAVVCVILQTLQSAFEKGTVTRLAYFICFLVVITLAISSFKVVLTSGMTTIDKMVNFMKLLLPLLLVLLTAVGGLTTTALLQPFLLVFLSFMSAFMQKIVFPLIFLTAVLCIANNISDNFKVSRLVGFFKQITKVEKVLFDREKREKMAQKSREAGKPEAMEKIMEVVKKYL